MPHILAYDLGGSSLRLAIVDQDGTFVDQVRKPLAFTVEGDRHEADPDTQWWESFVAASAELEARGNDFGAITAVAGCGFTRTQVLLDAGGRSIRPAIGFPDARAAPLLDRLRHDAPASLQALAQALSPYDPLARLLWLKEHEPENWHRLARVIEPKDHLNFRLTGRAVSDRISQLPMTRPLHAAGLSRLDQIDLDPALLPEQLSPFEPVGQVRPGLPAPLDRIAGAVVHCGSLDTWTCVLGSGALVPGAGYSISGTSDVFGVIADRPAEATGLLSVEWGPSLWQLGGPSQGAASRLIWAAERFHPGLSPQDALDKALATAGPAPLFLPFLDGERTPWWDPDLRGAFLGLGMTDDNDAMLRAVAEGMTYLSRDILSRAENATGRQVDHVSFSGGLSQHAGLCQLKADILDRPVMVPQNAETGLLGASRLPLGYGAAHQPLPPEACTIYRPAPETRDHHADRFEVFRDATEAIRPLSHNLARQNG